MSSPDADDADPDLARALADYSEKPSRSAEARVHAALTGARVYVPGVMTARSGASATATKALALLTLRAADESTGLAVFTSVPRLLDFRRDARPLPVRGADVLATAVEEGHASVVVDVQGPHAFVVDGDALRSLAAGYVPVAGAEETLSARVAEGRPELRAPQRIPAPGLLAAIRGALDSQPANATGRVEAAYVLDGRTGGGDWERLIALVLAPDADPAALGDLAEALVAALGPHLGTAGIGLMALADADGTQAERLADPVWRRGSTGSPGCPTGSPG